MKKLLNKMKIFHLILLILSGVLIISALPFKTQYNNIYVNVNNTIETATMDDVNVALDNANQEYLFKLFLNYTGTGFVDNDGNEFVRNFDEYKVQVYEFQNSLNSLNTMILWLGIISLVGTALLYLFSNNSRRIYYKSNIIVSTIFTLTFTIFTLIVLIKSFSVMSDFSKDSNLYNYVSVMQNHDINTLLYKDAVEGGNIKSIQDHFDCDVLTIVLYDVLFAVSLAYVIFVFILTFGKYKSTSERRRELEKVVTVND